MQHQANLDYKQRVSWHRQVVNQARNPTAVAVGPQSAEGGDWESEGASETLAHRRERLKAARRASMSGSVVLETASAPGITAVSYEANEADAVPENETLSQRRSRLKLQRMSILSGQLGAPRSNQALER
jgi:hypothetical protein